MDIPQHGLPQDPVDWTAVTLVTDLDIRAARDAWRAALDAGAPHARVAELHRGYERLVRTQGRQLGEAVRRRATARPEA